MVMAIPAVQVQYHTYVDIPPNGVSPPPPPLEVSDALEALLLEELELDCELELLALAEEVLDDSADESDALTDPDEEILEETDEMPPTEVVRLPVTLPTIVPIWAWMLLISPMILVISRDERLLRIELESWVARLLRVANCAASPETSDVNCCCTEAICPRAVEILSLIAPVIPAIDPVPVILDI